MPKIVDPLLVRMVATRMPRRRFMQATATLALATALAPCAWAQDYPNRPIRLIVGFAPGGSADTIGRLVGQKLSESLGQPVVVENRPGAGATIAADFVVKAKPDGYTLLVGDFASNVVAGSLYPSLAYDPAKDLENVALMVTFPFVLMVPAGSPVTSLKELIDRAKSKPGELRYSSAGVGASSHLLSEMLNKMAGIRTEHIPYKGGAPAVQALLTGEVDFTIQSVPTALAQLAAGKVRALGVTSTSPVPRLPDVPPIATVLPGYEGLNFHGLHAPLQTPPAITARINQEVNKILAQPDVRKRLDELSMNPEPGTPQQFDAFVHRQIDLWTPVVRGANIRAE